jgi:hypothetical protein
MTISTQNLDAIAKQDPTPPDPASRVVIYAVDERLFAVRDEWDVWV